MQYLVQFYPVVFPLAFRYSSFALLHFQAVIRQHFMSRFFDRLISTEIVLQTGQCEIDLQELLINCFFLFVYSCGFPPCKICVRDTGIKETICLWNAKSRDFESVILLEESEILLMIGICTLTAMVQIALFKFSSVPAKNLTQVVAFKFLTGSVNRSPKRTDIQLV